MGRYYHGDIEGKFWFGVQASTVGERFGCKEQEPSEIYYYIDEDDKHLIVEELERMEKENGEHINKFQKFFDDLEKGGSPGYNDKMLADAGLDASLLGEYADYKFGKKLLKCVEENGGCGFTAEL
jgi:hypothetical protein